MDFGPARFILMEYLLFCLYIDSNSVDITGFVVVQVINVVDVVIKLKKYKGGWTARVV